MTDEALAHIDAAMDHLAEAHKALSGRADGRPSYDDDGDDDHATEADHVLEAMTVLNRTEWYRMAGSESGAIDGGRI